MVVFSHAYAMGARMVLFVGITPIQLGLLTFLTAGGPLRDGIVTDLTSIEANAFRNMLSSRGNDFEACRFNRDRLSVDIINDTLELDGRFYRKFTGCRDLEIDNDLPFVAMVISSPSSVAAASEWPDGHAYIHTFVRLYMMQNITRRPTFDPIKWGKEETDVTHDCSQITFEECVKSGCTWCAAKDPQMR